MGCEWSSMLASIVLELSKKQCYPYAQNGAKVYAKKQICIFVSLKKMLLHDI
uniref:Uncharacterized protein n=1 Tax=Rhizophora mucronata TaxID=61149 RepID=A0A2P2PM83_RHIMU